MAWSHDNSLVGHAREDDQIEAAASAQAAKEEFTGFAWLREKKINQKIGTTILKLECKSGLKVFRLDNIDFLIFFRGTMDKREGQTSHNRYHAIKRHEKSCGSGNHRPLNLQ